MSDLNDSLDDLIGGASAAVRSEPVRAPIDYVPSTFDEVCGKCRGSGQTRWGRCFKCEGAGKKSFKTSPQVRQASRQAAAAKRAALPAQNWEDFKIDYPAIAEWIETSSEFPFAISMKQAVERWGCLTVNQMAACQKSLDSRARIRLERAAAAQAPAVDTAGVDRLKLAFDTAVKYAQAKGRGRSLKWPKITIGGVVISPAKPESNNPGALYVKENGEYLGKITGGHFYGRNCAPDVERRILAFIADPKAAAEAYGIETGTCCICNATLTNKASIERGIGPICGEKYGW